MIKYLIRELFKSGRNKFATRATHSVPTLSTKPQTVSKPAPEIYIFIIWHNALSHADEISSDLAQQEDIKIIAGYEMEWHKDNYASNMSRFYGKNLLSDSLKIQHCGAGAFRVLLVQNRHAEYGYRYTSKGFKFLNTKIFDLKEKYRQWTGGGHRIHASNDLIETRHDVALLFDKPLEDVLAATGKWDHHYKEIHADFAGENGWRDLRHFFSILNETLDYVVLRNFSVLPDQYYSGEHGDIDLLVSDLIEAKHITNAQSVFREDYRVHMDIHIKDELVKFDFRYLGDSYYDLNWQYAILANKQVYNDCFYTPDPINHFYSLLYHAIIHKRQISYDYVLRLTELAQALGFADGNHQFFLDKNQMKALLDKYMLAKNYHFQRPIDLSVGFNPGISNNILGISGDSTDAVGKILQSIMATTPLYEKLNKLFHSRVWRGKLPDGTDIAIKRVTALDVDAKTLLYREHKILAMLNHDLISKVKLNGTIGQDYLIVTEWCDGYLLHENVEKFNKDFDTHERHDEFVQALYSILNELKRHNVRHRDIWEKNLIINKGLPVLLDFGWAVFDDEDAPFTPKRLFQENDELAIKQLCDRLNINISR